MPTPKDDMQARFAPSGEQERVAAAMLAVAPPEVNAVVVPLALPDKQHGWWTVGQRVEYPGGFWLSNTRTWDGPLSHSAARNAASLVAREHLGDKDGTVGYAVIRKDGNWAVFEDVL